MPLGTVILVLLVLILIGSLPVWGYSKTWGSAPSGSIGAVLLVIVILYLLGMF